MSDPKPWMEEGSARREQEEFDKCEAGYEPISVERRAWRHGHLTGARAARVATLREVIAAFDDSEHEDDWYMANKLWRAEIEEAERE